VQQREFARRQVDRFAAHGHFMRGRIQDHFAHLHQALGASGLAARECAHAGRQLLQIEGLDEVIVGAGVEPGHAVGHRIACSGDENGNGAAAFTQGAQHGQAILLRQAQVQQQHGVVLGAQGHVGRLAVLHPVDGEAVLAQTLAHGFSHHGIVFHQQYAHVDYS
jgi:D-alanyl-D-alanine carboxypeptidase/D-alanyl-D-alanine-endopeptidase (penicillin-binding protein 4)